MRIPTFYRQLAALPLHVAGRRPDLLLALFVVFIASMLIVPLPTFALDVLITVNLAFSVTVLVVVLLSKRTLELTSFPTLLLVGTLFRLGLNVSTTRGILAHGDAGALVHAFGGFVVQGDLVVGATIFAVVTIVQLLVISKGAERVAEVAARFSLDAMPGKQMSIDAALRAGALTEQEAEDRRSELGAESRLFGNMDGAMKFVKGDALAGLVICAINLVAGFTLGVLRDHLTLADALSLYSLLSVGDGLVAQVSALLMTLSAAVLVTRVDRDREGETLGATIQAELFFKPKALAVTGALLLAMALIPDLPFLPFASISLLLVAAAASKAFFGVGAAGGRPPVDPHAQRIKAQESLADQLAPAVVPIGLDLDPELSRVLGMGPDGSGPSELTDQLIPQLRDALYIDTGVAVPGVRVRPDVRGLDRYSFVIRIKDVPVARGAIGAEGLLAIAEPRDVRRLGITAKPIRHPLSRTMVSWVDGSSRELLEAAGIQVWTASGVVALHLASELRKRVGQFLGLQEVSDLLARLERVYPSLVAEVVPRVVSRAQVAEVLRRLVDERVSIRDLKTIVEALGEFGAAETDVLALTERVRASLGAQLAFEHAGWEGRLDAIVLDPIVEEAVESGIEDSAHGHSLTLDPEVAKAIIDAIMRAVTPAMRSGGRPVILTKAGIRRYVRKLIELDVPGISVLSYDELPGELVVQPMGRAVVS
ncbi:MAG: FHIPEP family type III secretion protein [Deltaproteobacteria bacterium]|nr:FHIPEP family type III secretion protein [Deltaproteobacteria bacterium]